MSDKIKIAFVINTIASPSGGTEKQLLFLLQGLDRELFEPHLFCLYSNPWLDDHFSVCPLHILGINSFKNPLILQHLSAFAAFLRKENFSIVQTHFSDANMVGILGGKLGGVPVIISTRRGVPYYSNRAGLSILRLLNARATYFIANSLATRQWASVAEGISPDKIEVVHNGIDPDIYVQRGTGGRSCRRALNLPQRASVVGIVANLRPVKGIEIFLRAAALVCSDVPDTYFLVIGEGKEEPKLKALAQDLGLGERVLFLGKRGDVPSLLNALDVGVLSSHWESFSNAILEYLAAGIPVVCTDVGGCREVVEDGCNGFIVAPGDAQGMAEKIVLLLRRGLSQGERQRLRRRMEKEFSIEAMVEGHQNIYLRLLQGAFVPQQMEG
jgi:L-malate glycosyltransferase